MLLERAAKVMVQSGKMSVCDFTKKVLRDVALDQTTAKTFDHLETCAMLNNLPLADTV